MSSYAHASRTAALAVEHMSSELKWDARSLETWAVHQLIGCIEPPPMLVAAIREIGVTEVPGKASNPRIQDYYRAAGINPDDGDSLGEDDSSTPWCACFVSFCARQAGFGVPSVAPYRSREWLKWGVDAHGKPSPGDVVVFSRPPRPRHGHVALYICTLGGGDVVVLGGNQLNSVCVSRYPASRVLGYRRAEVP